MGGQALPEAPATAAKDDKKVEHRWIKPHDDGQVLTVKKDISEVMKQFFVKKLDAKKTKESLDKYRDYVAELDACQSMAPRVRSDIDRFVCDQDNLLKYYKDHKERRGAYDRGKKAKEKEIRDCKKRNEEQAAKK